METNNDILLASLRRNDKKALDEIYAQFHQKIYNVAYSYLKREDESLDVVQDAFIKLWENRASLNKKTKLEAYIYTVTKNSIISLFRKLSTEKEYLQYLAGVVTNNNEGTEEMTDYSFFEEQYEDLIEGLPPKRKEIFLLSRKKGFSNKEIAESKNISVKTVENQLTKALSYFKEKMDESGMLGILFYWLFIG